MSAANENEDEYRYIRRVYEDVLRVWPVLLVLAAGAIRYEVFYQEMVNLPAKVAELEAYRREHASFHRSQETGINAYYRDTLPTLTRRLSELSEEVAVVETLVRQNQAELERIRAEQERLRKRRR